MSGQYLRQCKLTVATASSALDISAFRTVFRTRQSDIQTPNSAVIRVYNLADNTVQQIKKEFTRVVLQVGYQGANIGTIFDGTIKQVRSGRESAVDTYVDILTNDGDIALNYAITNTTLAAGSSQQDQLKAHAAAMGISTSYVDSNLTAGGTLPRGKVLYGMSRDGMRGVAQNTETNFSVQDNEIIIFGKKKVIPAPAIVLNSATGLIGQPEQTEEGIKIRCLINPQIKIGRMLQVNNKSINQTTNTSSNAGLVPYDQYSGQQLLARVSEDGFYRALVVEHEGDTRGNDWYTEITALSVDQSSSSNQVPGGY